MSEAMITISVAGLGLLALTIALHTALRGWQGWLDVKKLELAGRAGTETRSPAIERIEIADLKERIRKLESIAACIDI